MIELIVLYKTPKDPEHFEKYYREDPRADDRQTGRTP